MASNAETHNLLLRFLPYTTPQFPDMKVFINATGYFQPTYSPALYTSVSFLGDQALIEKCSSGGATYFSCLADSKLVSVTEGGISLATITTFLQRKMRTSESQSLVYIFTLAKCSRYRVIYESSAIDTG